MGTFARKTGAASGPRLAAEARFFQANGFLPRPRLVQWLATLRCGLTCPHCLAASDDAGLADMPLDDALDLSPRPSASAPSSSWSPAASRWPGATSRPLLTGSGEAGWPGA